MENCNFPSPLQTSELSVTSRNSSSNPPSHMSPFIPLTPNQLCFDIAAEDRPSKKRRGRPPGAKNKPKLPTTIVTKPHIIQVHEGSDVIEALINCSKKINSGITILHGVGMVSDTIVHHPMSNAEPLLLDGPRSILSLNGTVVCGGATRILTSIGRSSRISSPSSTCFSVSLAGPRGEVNGGVVLGSLVAWTRVTVIAATFSDPLIFSMQDEGEENEDMAAADQAI